MGNTSSSTLNNQSNTQISKRKNSKSSKKANAENNVNKKEDSSKSFRLITLGASGVGKTSISFRFVSNIFITDYDPTIEDAYKKDMIFEGKELKLELVDTAGLEEYSSGVHDKSIRCGDGFILVFSISNRDSFLKIKDLRKKILWVKDKDRVPMVIVGNKSDIEKDRKVSKKEASALAEELDCRYVETSAKTNENIELLFNTLLHQLVEKKK